MLRFFKKCRMIITRQPAEIRRETEMTNYTTLKLTEKQVQALYTAMNFYYISYEGETEDELRGTIVPPTLKAHNQIQTKLAQAGWR
jgi:hypothetical protein